MNLDIFGFSSGRHRESIERNGPALRLLAPQRAKKGLEFRCASGYNR
jgi:hypothetical protein